MKGMVDVCAGRMTLKEVTEEITRYMLGRNPSRLIVDIQLKPNGSHATIWIPIKDFKKKARGL